MNRYILPICCILVLASCKKNGNSEPKRESEVTYDFDYKIENQYFPQLNYRVYNNFEDYKNNTNPLISVRLEQNNDTVIHFRQQKTLDTLYYDVFSDDYSYTNWSITGSTASRNSFTFKELLAGYPMHQFVTQVANLREVFFDGNIWSTKWRAIDMFDVDTNSA